MAKSKFKILLVEDDSNLSLVLQDYLELMGYDITLCRDGEQGASTFKNQLFDLCILDIMMPKKDGFTLAEEIRKINKEIPIIFLTAKALKEDRIKGFRIGGDDYVTKPFSTEELSFRIKAILKRAQPKYVMPDSSDLEKIYEIGQLTFDAVNLTISSGKTEQKLTRKEADLLKLLCINKNKILTREVALKTVWGDDDYFIGRSMDVFITKLRKYLKEDSTVSITNIHGTGFKLETKE
jgi:two-component system, OmpR family, response regulator